MSKTGRLLIFAGTTEGRKLAEHLEKRGILCHVCTATAYGGEIIAASTTGHRIHSGRMDENEMTRFMKEEGITDVVDATHPYAAEASANIRTAAEHAGCRYLRLLREESEKLPDGDSPEVIYVDSVSQAAGFLAGQSGNIFAATGSKELSCFAVIPDYRKRVFARVLSTPESVKAAADLGFQGKNLICMQGPFSEQLNTALLKETGSAWLVTKESGTAGGFYEKIRAAKDAGVRVVVVGRPVREEGYSLQETESILSDIFEKDDEQREPGFEKRDNLQGKICPEKEDTGTVSCAGNNAVRSISVIGIGMGDPGNMTIEAARACREADLVIGAKRMLETASGLLERSEKEETHQEAQVQKGFGRKLECAWKAEEICRRLVSDPGWMKAAILFSGDSGFYSGAGKVLQQIRNNPELSGLDIRLYSGISSLVYFCGRLNTSWEDVRTVSLHGRIGNLVAAVRQNKKVFVLAGKEETFAGMCRTLTLYHLGDVTVHAGCRLSYPEERILSGKASEMIDEKVGDLTAVLIENSRAKCLATHGLPDESFIRDKVPMTKEEVRAVSLAKLRLQPDSVLCDIGAGTGSVSIEAAIRAWDGYVYAIEQKEEAADLIRENQRMLQASNLEVICGRAPEALKGLPSLTHAFIGGSSGELRNIVEYLLRSSPGIRIVINAILLETVTEALDIVRTLPVTDTDICCVTTAKSRPVGDGHMMTGSNPVYVISFTGENSI